MTTHNITTSPVRAHSLNRRALLLQAVAAGLAAPALAAWTAPGVHVARAADSLTDQLDAVLAAGVAGGLPGVALHIERAGKLIYSGAAGVASTEHQTPLKAIDRFRIYSITKAFTATIVLQLVDEGVLSLDDTVARWLDDPAVARIPNTDRVTLRQLLTHTSGIYDYLDDTDSPFWADAFLNPDADWAKVWTRPELLAYADGANHAPYFDPGQGVYYSNTGFVLLGLIVEQATGHSFGDELRTRILTPLALADTVLAEGGAMPDGIVDAYQDIDGEQVNVTTINLSWAWAAGGIVSTLADVARFARALFAGDLMSPASAKEMFAFVPEHWYGFEFGMGVLRTQTQNGELVGMDGGSAGGTSTMRRLDAADLTVVVLTNLSPDEGATDRIRDEAVGVVVASA